MTFNKQEHINRLKPASNKLISYLSKKGIEFIPEDSSGDNIILRSDLKELQVSKHCFYRFSGLAVIYKEVGKDELEEVPVDDDMFFNNYMKSVIEYFFKN
jgi:hypothetical protein